VETISLALDEAAVSLTVSIGLVTMEAHFDLDVAAREADKRLYRAKRAGRNCVVAEAPAEQPVIVDVPV
jgi:PleD family two-component response regulator